MSPMQINDHKHAFALIALFVALAFGLVMIAPIIL